MRRETVELPETRVGNCCGCSSYPEQLYKIQGLYRYRCATCFEKETGHRHHLDLRCACREPFEGATPDDLEGIAWWNSISEESRRYWLDCAKTSVPQHAWKHFRQMQELLTAPA